MRSRVIRVFNTLTVDGWTDGCTYTVIKVHDEASPPFCMQFTGQC